MSQPDRIRAAADLLRAEAHQLENEFNNRYGTFVQEARITRLLGLSNRIHILRHMAQQLDAI